MRPSNDDRLPTDSGVPGDLDPSLPVKCPQQVQRKVKQRYMGLTAVYKSRMVVWSIRFIYFLPSSSQEIVLCNLHRRRKPFVSKQEAKGCVITVGSSQVMEARLVLLVVCGLSPGCFNMV